jgi:glycosyltransferase involved in cell wall biosynthesis
MKVIDSFTFFNEFDMLKLRLDYLNDVVDHFIISESNYTHSGKLKPYYLDEIWNDIPKEIQNKITRLKYEPDINQINIPQNVKVCDYENGNWKLEREQRDIISKNLFEFSLSDLFMISDVDEIPQKEVIRELISNSHRLNNDFVFVAKCDMFYYNFSTWCNNVWAGTVFSNIQTALKMGCDYFRSKRFQLEPIESGGWHFSYFGDVEKIKTKLQSFAHQEFNKDEYKNDLNILDAIKNKKDIFHRSEDFKSYNFNNYPEDLRNLIATIFSKEYYEMTEQEVITKPEYLHNNMPPLLEAVLNPDGTGGTEIMGRAWQDYVLPVASDLADWHWCVIPGDNQLSPDSSNIVWLHPHHMEEGIERLLDKEFQKHFKAYVFVSNWQYERFAERIQLPMEKCYVLKNATQPFEPHKKPEGKLQLMFHPNPIRGLDILLESIKLIPEEDFELHIYHELDPDERKKQYQQGLQTYEYAHINPQEEQFLRYCLNLANNDKRVVRHTRTNNSKIREQLMNTHIFAYPTYFMETSCICMIEALAAGCSVLSSNLAALPETGLGFARHYGFIPDREKHIQRFTGELKRTITEYREGKFDNTLQVEICNKYYSWETRVQDWVQFSKQLWRKG